MSHKEKYEQWLNDEFFDEKTRKEFEVITDAQDKDAVMNSLLICKMAAEAKTNGKALLDKINEIFAEHGYYCNVLDSFILKGKDSLEKITSMMTEFRVFGSPFEGTDSVMDYSKPVKAGAGFGTLPTFNVLKYVMENGSWIAVHPSDTESKIKICYSVKSVDRTVAEKTGRNSVLDSEKNWIGIMEDKNK